MEEKDEFKHVVCFSIKSSFQHSFLCFIVYAHLHDYVPSIHLYFSLWFISFLFICFFLNNIFAFLHHEFPISKLRDHPTSSDSPRLRLTPSLPFLFFHSPFFLILSFSKTFFFLLSSFFVSSLFLSFFLLSFLCSFLSFNCSKNHPLFRIQIQRKSSTKSIEYYEEFLFLFLFLFRFSPFW